MTMARGHGLRVLTINSGSSSLKVALYHMDRAPTLILSGQVERIGLPAGRVHITDTHGATVLEQQGHLPDHHTALQTLLAWLHQNGADQGLDAVGNRVVHGGSHYSQPRVITPQLVATLRELVPLAPDHLPQAIDAIEAVGHAYPALPQVACFDTAFHRHMPKTAQMYALPRQLWGTGVVRYGFHGLSCESIMHQLHAEEARRKAGGGRREWDLPPSGAQREEVAGGRVIIAHLGNGASLTAVHQGASVETTMGFSPTGGLVMGTRAGDLDPGVLLYLLEEQGLTPSALNTLVNKQAGLLGVSGISADMHDLLARESTDPQAAEAIELFCYQARKFVGALAASLGGLDTLIFTAGIGEHAAIVRRRICTGLAFLGIQVDPRRNEAHAPVISPDDSPVTVRVMKTDEDLMIARHTGDLIAQAQEPGVRKTH